MTDSNLKQIGSNIDFDISNEAFKETESFFDWDQTINKENIINNSYFGDESFNFIDEDNDINNKILKEAKNLNVFKEEEKSGVIPISDEMLKYLGFMDLFEGIGGNKNIPLKRPSDRIEINKLFKEQTGYTFAAFTNNDIPMKAIETPEFQQGLDNMYKFYEDKGFTIKIPERTNLTKFEQTIKGLGGEIIGGFGLDYGTKNLLGAGPWGIAAYVSINALGGGYLNYLSQEARLGQQGFIGQKEKFKWGELIGASGVQTIPYGVTDKGFKGIGKSFAFGGSLTGTETTIRNLIDEKEFPTFKEYLFSIGLGGGFAAIFKSGLETFDGLVTKYKGKSPKEISELITDKEVKDLNKFADNTVTLQKQIEQQPQAKVNKNNQNLGDFDFSDTRGKNVFYHGASQEFTLNESDTFGRGVENLYGDGLYVTDDLVTSVKYKKKNKIKGQETEGVVYEITEKQPVKFFDLDAPASPEKIEQIKRIFSFDDDDYADIIDRVLDDVGPNPSIGKIYDEIKLYSNRRGLSAATTSDIFSSFTEELQREGFGGFIHQGGNLAGKGKRLHKVKIYFDPANQVDIKKVDLDQFRTKTQTPTNNQTEKLGDPDFTPNQINPKQVSNTNKQFDLIANRVRELKDQGAFRGVKTFEDTIDGGIKLLANKKKLKRYAETYAKLYGLQPTDELNYALAESITFSVRRTSEINQDLINAINVSKDNQLIETKINELVDSIAEIDDWLRLSIPLRTEAGTALSAMRIPTQGLSAEEFAKLTPQGKYRLQNTGQTELSLDVSDQSLKLQDLKRNLLSALEVAKETGDYSAINKLTNTIKQSQIGGDSVETLSALYRSGLMDRTLTSFDKGMRIFNEIGINALLSAPSTNEVNFVSGVLETYTSAFELMLGAGNRTELDAAIRHFIKLHSDLSFSTKAFKKSWEMSDNYINRGSLKADYQERFIISSDDPGFVGKNINRAGKVIRLPSRLMTSVDALVQSPNLIAHIHYQGHIEGVRLGKKGKDLDNYIKGHLDTILEYYASNSGKAIKDPVTARILKRAQEFAKRSTFTEDIRTDGYIGFSKIANWLNNAANDVPLVRGLMAFVRTPFNITKRQLRRTPGLAYAQKQLQNDLQSVDPGVRNQARGQVRLANALGLTLFTMGAAAWVKPRDPNNPAGVILTGGGPDWKTKEGRAIWKNLYKNGWRPYSIGHLQRNKDGTPKFGADGKPVYNYTSYERIDPLSTWIGLMVDFSHIAPWLRPDDYDEFIAAWDTALARNLIDRTYTRQIYEATEIFYDEEKRGNFLARQLAARTPYANFIRYAKRMPDDILNTLGLSEKDREFFNTQRDLKVRKGDVLDKEGEEIVGAKDLRKLLNQMSETVPGMGGNLPLMYEHITDEPMLYPERVGPDLFSFVKKSTSKNNPIYTAFIELGIQIREPSDVITGKATDSQVEPFKLNTKQYAELRKEINTIIPESQVYGNRNIKQAMTYFINSSFYKDNIKVIRKNGILNSPLQVKILTKEFNKINNYYITEGEDAWIRKQPAETRNKQRNKKLEIYNKYNEEIQKIRALSSN